MKHKIKDINFLCKTTVQSIASQANIDDIDIWSRKYEDFTSNEIQNASGNTVAIQVDVHEINTYMKNIYSRKSEEKNASKNEVTYKEDTHEIFSNNIDNEDKTQNNVKGNFSDINVDKIAIVEQTSPIMWNNFQ